MTAFLDPSIVGCVSKDGYSYTKRPVSNRTSALKGRPRYRLKDTDGRYEVDLSMDMDIEQFTAFQSFWSGPAGKGTQQFYMKLSLDSALVFEEQDEIYPVRAVGAWTAARASVDRWVVNLKVELPNVIAYIITICDVILGDTDAEDDIYGGPIQFLAEDIIEPCEGVLG